MNKSINLFHEVDQARLHTLLDMFGATDLKRAIIMRAIKTSPQFLAHLVAMRSAPHAAVHAALHPIAKLLKTHNIRPHRHAGAIAHPIYLDIGSNDGSMTDVIGRSIRARQIHCVDVEGWYENVDVVGKCKFKRYNGWDLPYRPHTFDIITAIHVLHHVPDHTLAKLLNKVYYVLQHGGLFIIREHDIYSARMAALVDIQHLMYHIKQTKRSNDEIDQFIRTYSANYKSEREWDILIARAGLERIKISDTRKNVTYAYYAVYRKK